MPRKIFKGSLHVKKVEKGCFKAMFLISGTFGECQKYKFSKLLKEAIVLFTGNNLKAILQ